MRKPFISATIGLASIVAAAGSSHAQEWVKLELTRSGLQRSDSVVERVWADRVGALTKDVQAKHTEVAVAPGKFALLEPGQVIPSSFVSASFVANGATYIVSVMLQSRAGVCEDGPNSASATTNFSRCPLRLTKQMANGDLKTTQFNKACFVTPDPSSPDMTRARMEGDLITLETVNHSRPVDGCSLQLRTN